MIAQGIHTQYKYKGQTQEIQGISFRIGEDRFKGSQIDRKFSLGTGMAALILALLTISFKAIQAAVANPVESLRNE